DKGSVTDDRYATGSVGVRAVGDERGLWDSLSVTSADGSTLYTSSFDTADAAGDFPERAALASRAVAAAARPAASADA
ncbi:hypothetical protein FGX00_00330, partial [Xylella fastidiosa subsp. multiplex]|nr:hypothetical protein [Xylella fastidiosa subsp. multiplex]